MECGRPIRAWRDALCRKCFKDLTTQPQVSGQLGPDDPLPAGF